MQNKILLAKKVLTENTEVLYRIFGMINTSGYFPPHTFLNEFLLGGSDSCDQDSRMDRWWPFKLSEDEYLEIFSWWKLEYPNTIISDLNTDNWDDWIQEIIDP